MTLKGRNPFSLSLESVNYPGYFIRHQGSRLRISKNDGTALFKTDASWKYSMRKPIISKHLYLAGNDLCEIRQFDIEKYLPTVLRI